MNRRGLFAAPVAIPGMVKPGKRPGPSKRSSGRQIRIVLLASMGVIAFARSASFFPQALWMI